LIVLRAAEILDALEASAPLRLSVPCHCQAWCASALETDQIREYMLATFNYALSDKVSGLTQTP